MSRTRVLRERQSARNAAGSWRRARHRGKLETRTPQGEVMYAIVGRERFCEMFKGRTVMVPELPAGRSRVLAHTANQTAGPDDASLRTKSEYMALFDLLIAYVTAATPAELKLLDEAGRPTAAARVIEDYIAASRGKPEFFDADMYMFHVTGFQPGHGVLTEPVTPGHDARLDVWSTDPAHHRHIPDPDRQGTLFSTRAFSLKNSGNRTLRAPKRSWRIILDGTGHDNRLTGMSRINLKAMYNDPSQMREALAWRLFGIAGVTASRHTYAKLAFGRTYRGLFSVIEQVDGRFLRDHFGENHHGNLYKAGCRDIGCATAGLVEVTVVILTKVIPQESPVNLLNDREEAAVGSAEGQLRVRVPRRRDTSHAEQPPGQRLAHLGRIVVHRLQVDAAHPG